MIANEMRWILRSGAVRAGSAGLVGGAGFLFPALWLLVPLGLAFFFHTLWSRAHTFRQAFWYGLLFGFLVSGAGIFWFWDAQPLSAGFRLSSNQILLGKAAIWMYISVLLTLPIALASPLLLRLKRLPYISGLAGAALWIIIEEARMWFFVVGNYIPGIALGPHFSIASLGTAFAEEPSLLQLAYPFGIEGLAGAVALAAAALALLFCSGEERARKSFFVCAGAVALMILFIPVSYRAAPLPTPHLAVTLVTADDTDHRDSDARRKFETSVLEKSSHSPQLPDIIVFPEGYGLDALSTDRTRYLAELFPGRDLLLIDSTIAPDGAHVLTYASPLSGIIDVHKKIVFVPVGEYLPPFVNLISVPFNLSSGLKAFTNTSRVPAGTTARPVAFRGTQVGGLLCSELLSPSLYSSLRAQGASVLVNAANDSWFGRSALVHARTMELSRIHAVQNRAYFLVASANAPSFALDPYGRVIAEAQWGAYDTLTFEIGD